MFSFVLYLLVFLLFFSTKKDSVIFKPKPSLANITNSETLDLLNALKVLVQQEGLYKNPNLKVATIAKKLHVQPSQVSFLLNHHLGYGFPHFINTYRIEYAKELLHSNEDKTFEALGYECGFNSKSTFFAAFKKITGMTPSQWKAQSTLHQEN